MKRGFHLRAPKVKLVEDDVEQQCKDILRYRQFLPIRLQVGKFKTPDDRWITIGEPGLPDYVVVHSHVPGFFLETKKPEGALRDTQTKKIWELEKMWNLRTAVVDNVDALIEWLDRLKR